VALLIMRRNSEISMCWSTGFQRLANSIADVPRTEGTTKRQLEASGALAGRTRTAFAAMWRSGR
jgi:hypothetical protein